MIKYTWQNYEQLPAYEPQPAGTYFFKVMFGESTVQGGNGITCGSPVILARIAIANNQGEIVNQWKERFILHERTAWKWEAFLKCINFRNGQMGAGEQVEMHIREIVGCKGRADISLSVMEPRGSTAGSSVFVGQAQKPDQQAPVRYKNEVYRYHDNLGLAPDLEVRAAFDQKMAEMEAAAAAEAAQSDPNSFLPPEQPQHRPAPNWGQPNQNQTPAFPKPTAGQAHQPKPFPNPNLGNSNQPGYATPDLPSDDECPF